MKKLTTLLAIATFAVALAGASASACEKTCNASKSKTTAASATSDASKASCSASKATTTTASSSATCNKGEGASAVTTASAESCSPADCALVKGNFAVATMTVDGMTCGGCENSLTMAFEKHDGVVWVAAVSHTDGVAKVIFDKSVTSEAEVMALVNKTGFKSGIMPAVAVTTVNSDSKAGCTAAEKAACEAKKILAGADGKAECTAAEKAACAAKKGSVTTASADGCCAAGKAGSAKTTTASADHCKSGSTECAKLTSAERAGFCAKFCKTETNDSKKDI